MFSSEQVEDFGPEIAIISSPASAHLEQASYLLGLGADVLVEKPLSTTLKGVAEVFNQALDSHSIIQVGYNLRYTKGLAELSRIINSGVLGKIQTVDIAVDQYLPDWRPNIDYRSSVSAQVALGGGVLLELSHEIDYALFLFGDIEVDGAVLGKTSPLEIDVEDVVEVIGRVQAGNHQSAILRIHLGMVSRARKRYCEVSGSEGNVRWNGVAGTVEVFNAGLGVWQETFSDKRDISLSYERQLADFIESSQQGFDPDKHRATAAHEIKVLETIESIRARARVLGSKGGRE
jgi:predicted dehydrogenase